MARCCPRACGRLAAAAVFISVGIVQVIAAIVLLKSKYAYLLFGPNILSALCNITVGILLGIASTVWKRINKNSNKHSNRRKFLASLVGSILLLNSTTATMLIIGESNSLLAINLENLGVKDEILAYAYSASVCSPIVCVVISIAFLTGICFRQKPKTIKTLDFRNILNANDDQLYDWVYTSDLPKPDPEILKSALSSSSESTSSESESDSSADLPVPLHLRSRSSLSDIKNSKHGSLKSGSLQFSAGRSSAEPVSPDFLKTRLIPRLKHTSLIKTPVRSYDESINSCGNPDSSNRPMVAYKSECKPGTPVRIWSPSVLEKSTYSPNLQFNSSLTQCPTKAKLTFSPMSQGTTARRLQMIKRAKGESMDEQSTSLQSSMENSDLPDPALGVIDLSSKRSIYSPNPHSEIRRTSTTDHTKVLRELENLDNSAIHVDAAVTDFKEIYMDETLPDVNDKDKSASSSRLTDSGFEEKNCSFRSGGDLSIIVRNSNFRKKLSSRLVPASGPVISDSCKLYKTANRKSIRNGRMKPYSKSKNSYDKYLQTGFSSFKVKGQVDEVDTTMHTSKMSPMTSISEKPTEEEDSFSPSTSAHTSGYMSAASYEESEDEGHSISRPSPAQKLMAEEIRERYRKRKERVTFEIDGDR
ncbi:serine-rich adhesin for platelets [Parasteatoda tepidariorum]|uniref:serine-rich adhesin for platelets n=1 Tax=Parasteatoda tepidariorum TaxID=114398 RepID=UPI00077FA35A|nr:uncharacterized protein LOC107450520 [Parasteatoda tepidariorum]